MTRHPLWWLAMVLALAWLLVSLGGFSALAPYVAPRLDLQEVWHAGDLLRWQPFASLMAGILAHERLLSAPGGHDWAPWKAMWGQALGRVPLGVSKAPVLR